MSQSKTVISSRPEVFLGKGALKICSKSSGEHPCQSAILVKLQSNSIEIRLRHGCSPVNLQNSSETPFLRTPLGSCFWTVNIKRDIKQL